LLTPSRKRIGRAVARRSRSALVAEVLKDPTTKQCMMKRIGLLIRREMRQMCSIESILKSQSKCDLKDFTWKKLLCELELNAPLLFSILQSCTATQIPKPNREAVIGMCSAILLKHRFSKMSIVQKVISMILYAGNCSKQVSVIYTSM
jgi:hypothetical protein